MKIYATKTHIDLEAPIQMNEVQQERLIEFMIKIFPHIEVAYDAREAKRKKPDDINRTPIKWTIDDYMALLGPESNDEICEKLDRTYMSIVMKRGAFNADLYCWMSSKGYSSPISKQMVKEFLEERGGF